MCILSHEKKVNKQINGMQEKVSIIVVRYGRKFPSFGSRFGISRQSFVMPNRDPRDGNLRPYLTPMKDTYNLTRPSILLSAK